ncbi:MAG: tRNA (cytidine(34)-2'-O)-methyltransferase [Erysipelotrichaceae bacterium]
MKINVVLYQPEIPQNTGNIMRTCMASDTTLHLIEPLGFELSEKTLKRASMDYLLALDYLVYSSWEEFLNKNQGQLVFISRYAKKAPTEYDFKNINEDIYLVFGKESTGIPYEILHQHLADCIRIPMVAEARSLNLSNCVALMVYHVLAEFDYLNLSKSEFLKGENWIYNQRK